VLKPAGRILISDIVAKSIPWWVKKSGVLVASCVGGTIPEKDYLQKPITNLTCCGYKIIDGLLNKLTKPISRNVWSAKFSGKTPALK